LTSPPESRRAYIDRARGLAVLIMIGGHALDAWTRAADRTTVAYRTFTIVSGMAAPLFLWLAGVALVLGAERAAQRTGSRSLATRSIVRRGALIFLLAFLFRAQAFVLSPGSSPLMLLRVDVLNVLGPAIIAAGLAWAVSRGARGALICCAAIAGVVAMTTPLIRTAEWVSQLPVWLQWYLRPAGEHTTFTLFPWAGFVFAGAATGAALSMAHDTVTERRFVGWLAFAGAALIGIGLFTSMRPTIYPASAFWTSSPTYFVLRVGIVMALLGISFAISRVARDGGPLTVLERLGRHSLFIYWTHVELVYGYATWPIHHQLPLWATVAACGMLSLLMYRALDLRDWAAGQWSRKRVGRAPRPLAT
jgi:uncharacterized membrane protein